MVEIALPRTMPGVERRPRLGYAMTLVAASLFAVNGTVAKVILSSGITPLRLTELRATFAFVGLALILLVTAPARLRLWLAARVHGAGPRRAAGAFRLA